MARNNNTYGELINNKFCEVLTVNSTKTWAGMKELLDKKMPEKKKRKWLLWFTTKPGVIAIVLFSLFASATGSYIGLTQKSEKNDISPVKEIKNEIQGEMNDSKIEKSINNNNDQEKINILPAKKTKASLPPAVKIKNKRGAMQTSEIHKGKTNYPPVITIQLIPEQKKDSVTKNLIIIPVSSKDSINGSAAMPKAEIVERQRAF